MTLLWPRRRYMMEFPEIPLDKMRSVVGRFGITGLTQTLKIKVYLPSAPPSSEAIRSRTGLDTRVYSNDLDSQTYLRLQTQL